MSTRPAIAPEALREVVSAFPTLGDFRGIVRNGLSVNTAACLFETTQGAYFAKRYDPGRRDTESILAEHAIVRRLTSGGYPTPRLHENREAETLIWHKDAPYALYDLARGEDRYGDTPVFDPYAASEEALSAGRRLAELHVRLRPAEGLRSRPFKGITARYELLNHPTVFEGFEALALEAPALTTLKRRPEFGGVLAFLQARRDELAECLGELPRGVIHGDFIKRNLFWTDHDVSDVLDFDLWNVAPLTFDLALSLLPGAFNWPLILSGRGRPTFGDLAAFLEGYQSQRPLEAAERQALPAVMETARGEFYLSIVAMAFAADDPAQAERFWRLLVNTLGWFDGHPEWRREWSVP